MWFLAMHHKQVSVYQLGYDIHHEQEKELYLQTNGAPVEPYIYLEGNPNVPDETSLMAEPEQIGWFDEGDHKDELRDITIKEINNILDNNGHCEIDVEEEHLDDDEAQDDYFNVVPVLLYDKIIIRYDLNQVKPDEEDEYYDDDEDYNICGECNGSGEGMTEDSSCPICGGLGEIHDNENDDEDHGDWDHSPHYNF
jgi:hypothetical protein